MSFDILLQNPETEITERWVHSSETLTADNGKEQRISLASLPKRSWSGSFFFNDQGEIRRHVATMFHKFSTSFNWPLWTEQTKLKAAVAIGANALVCNTTRSDLREGALAILLEGTKYEVVTVNAITSDGFTIVGTLANAFSERARVCPIVPVYSASNAAIIRKTSNDYAQVNFSFYEYGFQDPFLTEAATQTLEMFAGYPVLNKRAFGTDFQETLITGLEATDYGGQPSLRSRWDNSQFGRALSFLCNRTFNPDDWAWWKTFADYCRGSTNPFFMPTFRPDFEIHTAAVGGGSTIVIADTAYSTVFQGKEAFGTIAITKPDGTQHFATVTGVATALGRDTLTFSPALPAGTWTGQTLGLLLKCRIADDTVSTLHSASHSVVTINLRTVD
jgi:hypothetical protein